MKVIKDKIQSLYIFLAVSIIFAIVAPIVLKWWAFALLGVVFVCVFAIKIYQLNKLMKNNDFFTVKAYCTDKTITGVSSRNFEFEPVSKEEYPDIINISIANDDSKKGVSFINKQRIQVGNCYNLVFKTDKDNSKNANTINFIGFERILSE